MRCSCLSLMAACPTLAPLAGAPIAWHVVSCCAICPMTCAEFCVPKNKNTGRRELLLYLADTQIELPEVKMNEQSSAHFKKCSLHRTTAQRTPEAAR